MRTDYKLFAFRVRGVHWEGPVWTVDSLVWPHLTLKEAWWQSDTDELQRSLWQGWKKGGERKKQDSMKRQNKNQMAMFYNVGWHMAYADQDASSDTEPCGLPWVGQTVGSVILLQKSLPA